MKIGLDYYDRNARFKPALILVLPLTLSILSLASDSVLGWSGALALIVQAGSSFLVAQIVGDIGKRSEAELFRSAGGRPTEVFLSHSGAPNQAILRRTHSKLARLLPDVRIPSVADEESSRDSAWEVYEACTSHLRARAHDQTRFRSVFRENVNYGFRRNLWAMKPVGLAVAAIGTVIVASQLLGLALAHQSINLLIVLVGFANLSLLLAWALAINPGWVMRAATLYAERLLEVLDQLDVPQSA